MALSRAQKTQLLTARDLVQQYRREMEDLVRHGRPPAGSSARLRPLPPAEADALLAPLRQLQHRLDEAVQALTGEDPQRGRRMEPLHTTRLWARNVADRLRDAVDALEPGHLATRYGRVSEADAAVLARLHQRLSELLAEARTALRRRT